MADAGRTPLDVATLATVRTLHYAVQFDADPASAQSVDWVLDQVVRRDTTGPQRAEMLDHVRRALASDVDLAAALSADGHTDAQIRAFLRQVAARIRR